MKKPPRDRYRTAREMLELFFFEGMGSASELSKNKTEAATEGTRRRIEKARSPIEVANRNIALSQQVAEVGDGPELAGENVGRGDGLNHGNIEVGIGAAGTGVV